MTRSLRAALAPGVATRLASGGREGLGTLRSPRLRDCEEGMDRLLAREPFVAKGT